MTRLLTAEQAWARIARHAAPLPAAALALEHAVGRIAAADVASPIDLPPFDRSAMDGYAVRAADTPGRLRVTGGIAAGDPGGLPVDPGTAVRIFTGGAIPPGADAVERQEVVQTRGRALVEVDRRVEPGLNIRRRGEDVAAGTPLLARGDRVTVQALTVLASAGLAEVTVHRPARVAVLLTGDELVPPGRPLPPGRIHESNGVALRSLAAAAGADVIDLGTAPDDSGAIFNRIGLGLHQADVLLVAGGVSVGEHDLVRPAFERAGVEQLFWGVKVKPGKPLFCGRRDGRWAFGLPGNPLSGIVSFLVFVEPLLRRLHGEREARERRVRARLTAAVSPADNRTTYLTATLATAADGTLEATPTEQQGSAMTLALAHADGFVIAPASVPKIKAGSMVDVLPLGA